MNREYERAFKELNVEQRAAVTQTDGPILVIAGPGTGKTQLIGARVGYILKNTDAEPSNILLLTFTDAAVSEMRKRLERLVPATAHKVNIYTYHGFANDLIRNNLDYFEGLENEPIDELEASVILEDILERLPYSHPLKAGRYYKKQILGFISDAKRALLTADDIEATAKANLALINQVSKRWRKHLAGLERMSIKSLPIFENLLSELPEAAPERAGIKPLSIYLKDSLSEAIEQSKNSNKTNSLTRWKDEWLAKDSVGNFIAGGQRQNERLAAASEVYRAYQQKLTETRAYDYDDMLVKAIAVLEKNSDFKYSLAEHYQYLMLDEFQDTNPAQMRLVELLSDHPVHEGRPNILAVGDDDQAIYAFQGADQGNMSRFAEIYRDVKVISLKQNFRSHQDLIDAGAAIAEQIETRLHHSFGGIEKVLVAAGQNAKAKPCLEAREFVSDAAQYGWVASNISRLIKEGTPPGEIAVLAPQHKYLERLVPYLANRKLPVAYEKREDVLEDPRITELSQIARLVMSLDEGNEALADHLWPEILSYEFWRIPTEDIWQIVWESKQGTKSGKPLTKAVLTHPSTKAIAGFILRLKDNVRTASLEEMLDAMIGIEKAHIKLGLPMPSPYYGHFFGTSRLKDQPDEFTALLSNLNLLRQRLRNRQRRATATTRLDDLVEFIDQHRAADLNILNTSPYHQAKEAVNLLTAYGAKGREFKAVFVIACQTEVWGHASRSRTSAIKLPANLNYISYQGMSDDERRRLFYVAITRAKSGLYLTSYQQTLDGRRQNHLEFLQINRAEDDSLTSHTLPKKYSSIITDGSGHIEPETLENYWALRHIPSYSPALKSLLSARLETYKLSATHLNSFIDVIEAGPESFFIYKFLGFIQAPSTTSAFGTAMHNSLAWASSRKAKTGKLPTPAKLIDHFGRQLAGGWLREDEYERLLERGKTALPLWLSQIGPKLTTSSRFEKNFGSENVMSGEARLTGKIDRLIVDSKNRRLTVVDIKTGRAYRKWSSEVKLHKFAQQLMFYKLLVEGSNSFHGYEVTGGIIEFVEPDGGEIVSLPYEFNDQVLADFRLLVGGVWRQIMKLELPDTKTYPKSLAGIKRFEKFLGGQ